MPDLREAVARGRIARNQIGPPDSLTAWSHTRRFDAALSLCRGFAGKRILDCGCGDGTFLTLTMMSGAASRLLTPGGTLVVSVPAESGVPVIIKQIVRTIAGWRNVGYYPGTTPFGFNWRVLHERLSRQFDVTRVVASPFAWLGPGLATQVWFICRVRKARLREPAGGDARYGEAGLQ